MHITECEQQRIPSGSYATIDAKPFRNEAIAHAFSHDD